ncbi:hypothetical protein LCGC14_2657990, partial [marine sediment metagenome]
MITAYDYPSAQVAEEAEVDVVLVGDSAAMTVLGYDSTLPVSMDEMLMLARAVRRGLRTQAAEIDPLDWPSWRGPEQNGISRETGIIDRWDPKAPGTTGNVLWRNDALGGISTPIVMRGKLYTVVRSEPGTSREGEKVVCADAATGKIIWESKNNVYLTDVPAERIGWACCAGDPTTGKVYAIGACG